MIGNYDDGTKNVRYRDVAEYATMVMLSETIADLKRQGKTITPQLMVDFRDNWTRDGLPVDFTNNGLKPSDIENLLRSTGATSFGKLDDYPTLREGIAGEWAKATEIYADFEKKGAYLHTLTDPEMRRYILENDEGLTKAFFVHKGKSARELDMGDPAIFYDRKTGKETYRGIVQDTEPNLSDLVSDSVENTLVNTQEEGKPVQVYESGDYEEFFGWDGGINGDVEYRGLKDVLGAYFTNADAEKISQTIDPHKMYNGEVADNSVSLLKHIRSNGMDFKVIDPYVENSIDVRMTSGENLKLRIFDEQANGAYVGRVYDGYNTYYNTIMGNKEVKANTEFTPEDAIKTLEFVTGFRAGKVKKAIDRGKESSNVMVDGLAYPKSLHVQPNAGKYRSLMFDGPEDAENYIKSAIEGVNAYVSDEFKADEIQKLIDEGLNDDDILVSSEEFIGRFEEFYSTDELIRIVQEEAVEGMYHSDMKGREKLEKAMLSIAGDYENGFNPAYVVEHMDDTGRGHELNAMTSAIKISNYDNDKLLGNEFAVNAMKEKLIKFDPETAKTIDEIDHPMIKDAMMTVQDTLKACRVNGDDKYNSVPNVVIDDNGIIRWEGVRMTGSNNPKLKWNEISGEIGQIMVPDENGIIKTNFNNDNNYGIVPGYTGHFAFDGEGMQNDSRMDDVRVKGFQESLNEQLRATVQHQITRPVMSETGDIPTTLDASKLNGLYHGDVYGKRIDLDFMETNQLDDETKRAIIQTLGSRVRFDNQYSDHATTSAETNANRDYQNNNDSGSFSYWKAVGETNMRVLGKELENGEGVDYENYFDLTMTGSGKTQGLVVYLCDDAKVNDDGSVTPSEGVMDEHGNMVPDSTSLKKLDYFKNEMHNAGDRTQMSANQLMTAERVDRDVNTALITFGGWNFNDSFAVSQEFADRNQIKGIKPNEHSMEVLDDLLNRMSEGEAKGDILKNTNMVWSSEIIEQGLDLAEQNNEFNSDKRNRKMGLEFEPYNEFLEEHGRFRPLQRGDKLSDFGGNKGTIGIIIDRHMDPAEAKELKLDKEVRFMKANPELDAVGGPYSMMSRHNAGVVIELMGELDENGNSINAKDLTDPDTGEVFESSMGKLNFIITDMAVDKKTKAYTEEDVLDGKGRKFSGQLAWGAQSKNATGILNEVYGRNESAWETLREYTIVTGLDMASNGVVNKFYTPHKDENGVEEQRQMFDFDGDKDGSEFLRDVKDKGGFLNTPFELEFKTGVLTKDIPVLSSRLRQDTELIDGTMKRSDFNNSYANIYDDIGEYLATDDDAKKTAIVTHAQEEFDKIQNDIIDRQLDGGHNGKHSFIRDKVMGVKMPNSATAVSIVDPRLNIGEASMNTDIKSSLRSKDGDIVMIHRDPVWRDGAIRSMEVKTDETVNGIAFSPISDGSHDADNDGDTFGITALKTDDAQNDLKTKFNHSANMIDKGNGKDELYFQFGMDLASAEAKAERLGDSRPKDLKASALKNGLSNDPRLQKKALTDLNEYAQICFREHGYGSAFVSLKNEKTMEASFAKMVDEGGKGSPEKLEEYMGYFRGEKTMKDAREIQYANGVKTDCTGLAGAFSQKLVAAMRNQNIEAALEAMYPVTQGTLSIKHDANQARTVNEVVSEDLNKIFRGVDPQNSKKKLTPHTFKSKLTDTLENKMQVDVNEEFIDAITETMTVNGQILPLKDIMAMKGSPMDRVAYGGGYEELKRMAEKGESLLEGEQSKMFAPFTMRNAKDNVILAKKDTIMTVNDKEELNSNEIHQEINIQGIPETNLSSVEPLNMYDGNQQDEGLSL